MKPGQVKEDELYVRCIFCGDSPHHPNKAHLHINLRTGFFHCFRCQKGGMVPSKVLLRLASENDFTHVELKKKDFPQLIRGAGSERDSILTRYHTEAGDDAFYMYQSSGRGLFPCGIYIRGKIKKVFGERGINWSGSPKLPRVEGVYRLVEGPYDTLQPNDICLFSLFPTALLDIFKLHSFYLVPDGDVWLKPDLQRTIESRVNYCLAKNYDIKGVVFLPKGLDPDQKPEEQIIPISYFKRSTWKRKSSSSKVQQEVARLSSSSH